MTISQEAQAARLRLIKDNEVPPLPDDWLVERFRFLFRESKERNGDQPVGDMLSVSEYRGVVRREYEHEEQRRNDEELQNYRVVRPGQLAVNTMWLNHLGLGVSAYLGHVSPAYAVYDISDRLDTRFAHHLLRSQYYLKIYLRYLYGIRPNSFQIKSDDWNSIPVIVPPLRTQRAIADFLDRETARIDQLIEKKAAQKELFVERWRSEIDAEIESGRATSGASRLTKLARLINPHRPITYGIVQPGPPDPEGIPMVRGQDYSFGWVKREDVFHVSPEIEKPYARARLRTNDVVLTIVGAGVGNTAVVPPEFEGANITQTTARLAPHPQNTNPNFLHFLLSSSVGRRNVEAAKKGRSAARPHVERRREVSCPVDKQELSRSDRAPFA